MPDRASTEPSSAEIDAKIDQGGWKGETLLRARELIRAVVPDVVEEIKYRKPTNPAGVPVWSRRGTICTGEIYEEKVKLTFANGASHDDPAGLFNSSLGGKVRRAIDLRRADDLDEEAFKNLVQAAADFNTSALPDLE